MMMIMRRRRGDVEGEGGIGGGGIQATRYLRQLSDTALTSLVYNEI